jgi:hypothetical protein
MFFAVFRAFFEGFRENAVFLDGFWLVNSWWDVVECWCLFRGEKMRHGFRIYFGV